MKTYCLTRFEPVIRSRYEKHALKSVLNEVLGDKTLGQITIPLLLPATDIGNSGVHVFKSNYSSEFTRD